MTWTNLSSC